MTTVTRFPQRAADIARLSQARDVAAKNGGERLILSPRSPAGDPRLAIPGWRFELVRHTDYGSQVLQRFDSRDAAEAARRKRQGDCPSESLWIESLDAESDL